MWFVSNLLFVEKLAKNVSRNEIKNELEIFGFGSLLRIIVG